MKEQTTIEEDRDIAIRTSQKRHSESIRQIDKKLKKEIESTNEVYEGARAIQQKQYGSEKEVFRNRQEKLNLIGLNNNIPTSMDRSSAMWVAQTLAEKDTDGWQFVPTENARTDNYFYPEDRYQIAVYDKDDKFLTCL